MKDNPKIKRRLLIIFFLILLLANVRAYNLWLHNNQYDELLKVYEKYREISDEEGSLQEVWFGRIDNGARTYDWVATRSSKLSFFHSRLDKKLEAVYISPRFTDLRDIKKELNFVIDDGIKRLLLSTTLNLESISGILTKSDWRKFDLSISRSAAANEKIVDLLEDSEPSLNSNNYAKRINYINEEPWLKK